MDPFPEPGSSGGQPPLPDGRTSPDRAMRAEARSIADDPHFRKSPTLSRLLDWLVEQTIAGKGDSIKSYTVAVDGLGRASDFDTQADSYPRVQMARLRKALESHYAQFGPVAELCLYLRPGSYRIRMGQLATAYPQLYRPLSAATPQLVAATAPAAAADMGDGGGAPRRRRLLFRAELVIAVLLLLLAAMIWAGLILPRGEKTADSPTQSPVVEITRIDGGVGTTSSLGNGAYAFLADGFSRSWVTRLRLVDGTPTPSSPSAQADYRLETQLGPTGPKGSPLYIRLQDLRSSTLVWSDSILLQEGGDLAGPLAPLVAELTGPFGVIAQKETQRLKGRLDPGYACLMGYMSFLQTRDQMLMLPLQQCLAEPSPEQRLDAARLAIEASFLMEGETIGLSDTVAVSRALDLSRQAIKANPKEAYAHFTYARALFVAKDCVAANHHSLMAMQLNPYDPLVLAVLGALNSQCGYPVGKDMLDQAFRFRVEGGSYARLALILGYIVEKRPDRLRALSEPDNQSATNTGYHYVCEAIIAAALDDIPAAKADWAKVKEASPHTSPSADALLAQFIFSPLLRQRITMLLVKKGVIKPGEA